MKISAALLELVEPFYPEPPTLQELQTIVAFGAIAWNASILDGAEREEHLRMMMGEVEEGDPALFESLLRDLIARKLRLFPDDRRLVASWEVTKNGSSCKRRAGNKPLPGVF